MRDKKLIFVAEDAKEKNSRSQPQAPHQEVTITSAHLMDDRIEPAFSRELVVRLINWVKHI